MHNVLTDKQEELLGRIGFWADIDGQEFVTGAAIRANGYTHAQTSMLIKRGFLEPIEGYGYALTLAGRDRLLYIKMDGEPYYDVIEKHLAQKRRREEHRQAYIDQLIANAAAWSAHINSRPQKCDVCQWYFLTDEGVLSAPVVVNRTMPDGGAEILYKGKIKGILSYKELAPVAGFTVDWTYVDEGISIRIAEGMMNSQGVRFLRLLADYLDMEAK